MLNELSWGDYLKAAGLLVAIYYLAVAVLYYRKEIRGLLARAGSGSASADTGILSESEAFEVLEVITKEINSILEQAGKGASKPDLLARIRKVLANYGGLRIPAYKVAVFNHIIHEAQEICGVGISVQELEG